MSRIGFVGPAWGDGPAYPGIFSPDQTKPLLFYDDPIPASSLIHGSAWFGQKVLWVVDRKANRESILIRGRRLDALDRVRFGLSVDPVRQMTIGRQFDNEPSTTRVRGPGCYAYQVDGPSFSSVIVFEAAPWPS